MNYKVLNIGCLKENQFRFGNRKIGFIDFDLCKFKVLINMK